MLQIYVSIYLSICVSIYLSAIAGSAVKTVKSLEMPDADKIELT